MMEMNTIEQILDKATHGKRITADEANILINPELTNLNELLQTANLLTRRVFGNEVSMCAIYPAKVGQSSSNCAFCAQSAHHNCDIAPIQVGALDKNEIINNAKELWGMGVRRTALLQAANA